MGKQNRFSGGYHHTCCWIGEVFGALAKTLTVVTAVAYFLSSQPQKTWAVESPPEES
jgi:hypothetical protein